jgi:hypothetical protein
MMCVWYDFISRSREFRVHVSPGIPDVSGDSQATVCCVTCKQVTSLQYTSVLSGQSYLLGDWRGRKILSYVLNVKVYFGFCDGDAQVAIQWMHDVGLNNL